MENILLAFFNKLAACWLKAWPTLQPFLSSATFAAVVASVVTPLVGIKTFLNQQRVGRVQKIYYEDSLLEQLKHLDNTIEITSKNLAHFKNSINLIINDLKMGPVNPLTSDTLSEMAKQVTIPTYYPVSRREIVIILFKEAGYKIHQWLIKYDRDFNWFNLHIKEIILKLLTKLQHEPEPPIDEVKRQYHKMENKYRLIMRHYNLSYLFNDIVSNISTLDFRSKKDLINTLAEDKHTKNILENMKETFKFLCGYYQLSEDTFLSYLTYDTKYRFKLTTGKNPHIEMVPNDSSVIKDKEVIIVKDDFLLADLQLEFEGEMQYYASIQRDLVNWHVFRERPKFYKQIDEF